MGQLNFLDKLKLRKSTIVLTQKQKSISIQELKLIPLSAKITVNT